MATILIADDSPTEVMLFEQVLTTLGHQTLVARDGEEAVAMIAAHRPDLVLLDVVMPRKDGYFVCRAVKSDPALAKVRIIIISTRNQESDRYWGFKQGADAYLGKPFNISDLVDTVRSLLETR